MEYQLKLISLLEQYIEENKKIKNEYQEQQTIDALYEELINILNTDVSPEVNLLVPILLNTIYKNDIYVKEYYDILYAHDKKIKLRHFINKIKNQHSQLKNNIQKLKQRISRNKPILSSAYMVKGCLKYNAPISQKNIICIKQIISYYETAGVISRKEAVLLINTAEMNGFKMTTRSKFLTQNTHLDNSYKELNDILSIGFQQHDNIEISQERKPAIDSLYKELYNTIKFSTKEELLDIIETYKRYHLNVNEYNYLIIKLLDEYLEELVTLYELLLDQSIYPERTKRLEVMHDYYNTLERYILLREYYNKTNEYVVAEAEDESKELKEERQERIIIYSHSGLNITKSRIISDMSDIAYEYYQDIYDLISKFKDGTLSKKKIKPILNGNNNEGNFELKDDAIRIVIKRIKENIYTIQGVFIKKDNNDTNMYRKIINRPLPSISNEEDLSKYLELSKIVDLELEKLIKEKGRTNGRK